MTDTDVEIQGSDALPSEPSPRGRAMDEVIAHRQEVFERELAGGELQDDERSQPDTRSATRTIDVDGQEVVVTNEQADQLARLGMVANAAMYQHQQQPPRYEQHSVQPLVDPSRVREAVRNIQYGDEDDAAQALTGLITEVAARIPPAPTVDPRVIARQVSALTQQQHAYERDVATIKREYSEIFADPQRQFLAKVNVEAIRARNAALGRQQSDIEIYREAGNTVRDAMGGRSSDRRGSSSSAGTYRPSRGSDIVAQMQRARGQYR